MAHGLRQARAFAPNATILALCLALAPAVASGQGITAALAPAKTQPAGPSPYRAAELVIENHTSRPLAAVSLHATEGGPTLLYPVTVPPKLRSRLSVALPAASPEQTYTVMAFDAYDNGQSPPRGQPLASTAANISWPVESLAEGAIVNSQAFEPFVDMRPGWPSGFRLLTWIILLTAAILSGFAMLISAPVVRWLAVLGVSLAAAGVLVITARDVAPPLTAERPMQILQRQADGNISNLKMNLLGARRTSSGQGSQANAWVVYDGRSCMLADSTILRPLEPRFSNGVPESYSISPGQQKMLVSYTGMLAQRNEVPRVRQMSTGLRATAIVSDQAIPGSILITAEQFSPLPPMAAEARMVVSPDEMEPLRRLWADGSKYGFNAESLALLEWWDRSQRRGDQTYLLWPARDGQTQQLIVATVTPAQAESQPANH